jgi:DNA polymerase III sliding clamp (beta) subunit (PCNA family)
MDNQVSRESLSKVLNLARPALSNQSFVPILTHFCFDGALVTAYNDVQAIGVRFDAGIECSIPGDTLIKLLNSLSGEKVSFIQDGETVTMMCGKSKLKLPVLGNEKFMFEIPQDKNIGSFMATGEMLEGISKCLVSVGQDPTHPSQMGITVWPTDKGCDLYSTDNATISRFSTNVPVSLPGDSPIVLPTFFCEQLVVLAREFPSEPINVLLYRGSVVAHVGDSAMLFSKLVLDLEPMDFGKVLSKYVDSDALTKQSMDIPVGLDSSISRAQVLLSSEPDPSVRFDADGLGTLVVSVKSAVGDLDDQLEVTKEVKPLQFGVDPEHVSRASRISSKMVMLPSVLLFGNKDFSFLHLIAHHR